MKMQSSSCRRFLSRSYLKFQVQGVNVRSPNPKLETRDSKQRRIQVRKDASEDIRVDLDSSTPCWNDAIGGLCFNDRSPSSLIFTAALLVDREAQ
jgi:hypothetical protein